MIRRDMPAEGPLPARWALIPQIEHAHLAGRLAEHWGAGGFAGLQPRDELLWAVYHHDDGWRDWDQRPGVEAKRGQPRTFTEMEIDDSTAIWSRSIDAAAEAGRLQGYLVAGHFCALARRAAPWKNADASWQHAERFLDRYEAHRQSWLQDWQAESPTANTEAIARRALAHLQFFDSLSLWLCCAEPSGTDAVPTPGGAELALDPQDAWNIRLAPWPLDVERLNVEVRGRAVAVGHFASREALAAAPSQPLTLAWQLQPRG
jgi:hypothetical protein